jgi:radical SAM enzyme (TIGR01210 family)
MKQVDFIFDFLLSPQQKEDLRKIIISNNGSILDEDTFSTTALMYFFAKMNIHCPNITVLSMETRAEYVDLEELEVLARALKEGKTPTDLELAIGFEAFDDTIRNDYFYKGLSLETFENMAKMIAKYDFKLKVYFMLKPVPNLSEEEAIEDVKNGINYLDRISGRYSLDMNMHLNPTYVASGTVLEREFTKRLYKPPLLESVRKAVLEAEGKKLSVFVGLYDEGLAVPGGSFIRAGDEKLLKKLEVFNRTQDFTVLKKI